MVTWLACTGAVTTGALYLVEGPGFQLLSELMNASVPATSEVRVQACTEGERHEAVTGSHHPGTLTMRDSWPSASCRPHPHLCGPERPQRRLRVSMEQALAELGGSDPSVSELAAALRC